MIVFATALLGKIALNARLYHYGFALAGPATMLVVAALVGGVPHAIGRRGGDAAVFRAGVIGLLAVGVFVHLQIVHGWFATKTHVVGRGRDAFLADERGVVVAGALAEIAARMTPGETLAALAEGIMLNYLSRRRSPVGHVNFMPVGLLMFGEEATLAAFAAAPPDWVALVHKDAEEYGVRFFGRDYGQRLRAWVERHYREVALVGARPFQDDRFGILLLRRTAR